MDNERGQSLITKYVWVIETIYRKRKISFKELNELWLRDDISRGVDIPKRTFDNWRYVIWDMFGINIVNEGRGEYRYYIENEEDISKKLRTRRTSVRMDFVHGYIILSVSAMLWRIVRASKIVLFWNTCLLVRTTFSPSLRP